MTVQTQTFPVRTRLSKDVIYLEGYSELWDELPDGDIALDHARRHPAYCTNCRVTQYSAHTKDRARFVEQHQKMGCQAVDPLVDLAVNEGDAGPPVERVATRRAELFSLDLIDDNPWQPRREIGAEALRELAEDIRLNGLLQVPLARPAVDGRYELAFGHRRIAAVRLLQQEGDWGDYVELDIEDLTDERMVVIALSENVQRKQLTDIEVVRAYKRAIDETNLTIQALADRIKLHRSTLSNNLRILSLPDFVLEHVESGEMSMAAAREFLVLQHDDHSHLENMRDIVRNISRVRGSRGRPDWTTRHVRERIYLQVAYSEKEWRPLGPVPPAHSVGEANREPTFDVDAFRADYPGSLHTIPAVSKTETVHYEQVLHCDASRLWTCEVKEWSRRQSRATREANKAAPPEKQPQRKKANDSASQLGELLAKDPVWQAIAAARDKKGPHRPVTDEERLALGTRAEMKDVSAYSGNPFHRWLVKAQMTDYPGQWESEDGGLMPPFFPLDGCSGCTTGAAYGKRRHDKPVLACFNKRCYNGKAKEGAEAYRGQLEDQKKEMFRQDRELFQAVYVGLESAGAESLRSLATVLLVRTDKLELQHPFKEFLADWSYESLATSKARELLNLELKTGNRGVHYLNGDGLKALEAVESRDLRELVAWLTVHHLRIAHRLDAVSQETVDGKDK